jgi:hypothetical protein
VLGQGLFGPDHVGQAHTCHRFAGEQLVVAFGRLGLDGGFGHRRTGVGGVQPVGQGTGVARFGVEPDKTGVLEAGAHRQCLQLLRVERAEPSVSGGFQVFFGNANKFWWRPFRHGLVDRAKRGTGLLAKRCELGADVGSLARGEPCHVVDGLEGRFVCRGVRAGHRCRLAAWSGGAMCRRRHHEALVFLLLAGAHG